MFASPRYRVLARQVFYFGKNSSGQFNRSLVGEPSTTRLGKVRPYLLADESLLSLIHPGTTVYSLLLSGLRYLQRIAKVNYQPSEANTPAFRHADQFIVKKISPLGHLEEAFSNCPRNQQQFVIRVLEF
jgi:hypothetical protein